MSDEYKKLILDKIREEVNRWIDELKEKHEDLMLTRQWQVLFPKGFQPGHIILPVITSSRNGKHLVANVEFVLPDDLHLDIENMKLALKDEAFKIDPELVQSIKPIPIDEPLDLLNRVVIGVNEFIRSLTLVMPMGQQLNLFKTEFGPASQQSNSSGILVSRPSGGDDLDKIRRDIVASPHLPEWIKTIGNKQVYDELIDKLVPAYIQYHRSSGGQSSIKDFFDKYTSHLLSHGHLHYYCKYKGKPVELDEREYCQESFCSKKPYNAMCSLAILKFGKE
jgi:hypothetical protein